MGTLDKATWPSFSGSTLLTQKTGAGTRPLRLGAGPAGRLPARWRPEPRVRRERFCQRGRRRGGAGLGPAEPAADSPAWLEAGGDRAEKGLLRPQTPTQSVGRSTGSQARDPDPSAKAPRQRRHSPGTRAHPPDRPPPQPLTARPAGPAAAFKHEISPFSRTATTRSRVGQSRGDPRHRRFGKHDWDPASETSEPTETGLAPAGFGTAPSPPEADAACARPLVPPTRSHNC